MKRRLAFRWQVCRLGNELITHRTHWIVPVSLGFPASWFDIGSGRSGLYTSGERYHRRHDATATIVCLMVILPIRVMP